MTYEENEGPIRHNLGDLGIQVLLTVPMRGDTAARPLPDIVARDIALLQHSSGTTALKKGVQLTHEAIEAQVISYSRTLAIGHDDCIATWLPLYHDMGLVACFLLPVMCGLPIVSIDAFEWVADPSSLLRAIENYRCTHVWLPNFAFEHLVRTLPPEADFDLSSMKAFINCSEPCKADTFNRFHATTAPFGVRRKNLQTCYAMAETVFAVTQTLPDTSVTVVNIDPTGFSERARAHPVKEGADGIQFLSVGQTIAGLQVRIVDKCGNLLPPGAIGEVTIKGDCLFTGYFRLSELTSKRIRDGWYYSGDLGFLLEDELFITGRLDDLIIVNGRNYYAHDVEYLVNEIEGIKPGRAVAIGVPNEQTGSEDMVIISESELTDPIALRDLQIQVKKRLKIVLDLLPKSVCLVEPGWLVKTTSGKISRRENLQKWFRSNPPKKFIQNVCATVGDLGTSIS
ncbi:MAG: AMP-binding protein [bacterium]